MISTPRHGLPSWIVRAADTTARMPVSRDGVLTAPDSGTYTLRDETETAVVDAAAVTIVEGVAQYQVAAAVVPATRQLSFRWRETWSLVFGSETVLVSRQAALVRFIPLPTITVLELERDWEPILQQAVKAGSIDMQQQIDGGWEYLLRKLMSQGRRPPDIMDSWQLTDAHALVVLWKVFNAGGDRYRQKAADYHGLMKAELAELKLNVDNDQDGQLAAEEEDTNAVPALVIGGARPSALGYGWSGGYGR